MTDIHDLPSENQKESETQAHTLLDSFRDKNIESSGDNSVDIHSLLHEQETSDIEDSQDALDSPTNDIVEVYEDLDEKETIQLTYKKSNIATNGLSQSIADKVEPSKESDHNLFLNEHVQSTNNSSLFFSEVLTERERVVTCSEVDKDSNVALEFPLKDNAEVSHELHENEVTLSLMTETDAKIGHLKCDVFDESESKKETGQDFSIDGKSLVKGPEKTAAQGTEVITDKISTKDEKQTYVACAEVTEESNDALLCASGDGNEGLMESVDNKNILLTHVV